MTVPGGKASGAVVSELAGTPGEDAGGTRFAYLALRPDPVFVAIDEPTRAAHPRGGVLFVPPFGWDELSMHRSARAWARRLADDGWLALRLDLPGTGDSGGTPRDPERVAAWLDAVSAGAAWLRARGCPRNAAIGIGLGGVLALRAVADGAPIEDLVLWGVPSRGSRLLRELQSFAQLSQGEPAGAGAEPVAAAQAADGMEVSGFFLSAETVAALRATDLTKLTIPDAAHRRMLLLGRDSLPADQRLAEHLEHSGVRVTSASGAGYGAMLTHPQFAEPPEETITRTLDWLDAGEGTDEIALPHSGAAAPALVGEAELAVNGVQIHERPFHVRFDGRSLVGVLATPAETAQAVAPLTAVLLNAGAVRRVGPNRMWVETARRWAAQGVPTLRLDPLAFGDSDGDERPYRRTSEFYGDNSLEQIRAAMAELERQGLPGRFLLLGLCSSAYWGLRVALADRRVRSLVLMNLSVFVWSDELGATRDTRRALELLRSHSGREVVRLAFEDGRIPRLLRAKAHQLVRGRVGARKVIATVAAQTDEMLDELNRRGVLTLVLLSGDEPLAAELEAAGWPERASRWPNLRYQRIPVDDHIVRPVWAQRFVHDAFDDALSRALGAEDEHSPS